MRKKHQPGCPCCTTEEGYPCDCPYYQLRINITDAEDEIVFYGPAFFPGPCNPMRFTGFSAINGTYYIDWPTEPTIIEILKFPASNNPQITTYMGDDIRYCLYLRVTLECDGECNGNLVFDFRLRN